MNTHEQEEVAKFHLNWKALLKAWAWTAVVFMIASRGFPWISAGFPDAVVGRSIYTDPMQPMALVVTTLVHLLLSFLYSVVIGSVIYRFNPLPAIATGVLIALGLYLVNYLVFRGILGISQTRELWVALAHFIYGLFFSCLYKGMSVPRAHAPLRTT